MAPLDNPMAPSPPDQMEPVAPGAEAPQTVIATILANEDGTYTIQKGGAEDGGAGSDTFKDLGEMLKGVLDLCRAHEGGTGGGAEDNFAAGFEGKEAPIDKKAPPAPMA